MVKFDRTTLAILSPGLIMLCGCQDLVPHDTQSLLAPTFSRSEIIGFLAGLGTTRRLPDPVRLLRIVDCLAASDRLEHDRGPDQLHMRRRAWLFRSQRKIRMTCLSDDNSQVISPWRRAIRTG